MNEILNRCRQVQLPNLTKCQFSGMWSILSNSKVRKRVYCINEPAISSIHSDGNTPEFPDVSTVTKVPNIWATIVSIIPRVISQVLFCLSCCSDEFVEEIRISSRGGVSGGHNRHLVFSWRKIQNITVITCSNLLFYLLQRFVQKALYYHLSFYQSTNNDNL